MAVGDLLLAANGHDLAGRSVPEIVGELTGPKDTYCVLLTRKGKPPFPTQTVVLSRTSTFMLQRAGAAAAEAPAEDEEAATPAAEIPAGATTAPLPHVDDFSEVLGYLELVGGAEGRGVAACE